jgi:3-oxoacyl-[acyl-carrier protein] reductase
MRLASKVAIVTGAAQGIGEAYARRFAAEGARVVVTDVNDEKGRAVATSIGGEAVFERLDVSSEDDTARCAQAVRDRFGRIDVLVNNAAIYYGIEHMNWTFAYLRKIFDVNYFGAWLMSRAVFPHMRAGGGGSIINQSSGAAFLHPEMAMERPETDPLPSFHYSVTKAAINAMTHYMAGSVGRFGIRVNAIAPGVTMTEATKQGVPEGMVDMIVQYQMAIHRPLQAEDVTGTAVWLASDDSAMVTGQVIVVDGGWIMLG